MRYFFILGALFFVLTPAYADELQDIREALGREDYISVSTQLLAYLDQFPENTEFAERIITLITVQLESQRVGINQFLKQVEKNPDNLSALQKAAATMAQSGGVFGFDLEVESDTLLDISLMAQEYNDLDAVFDKIKRAYDARRFVSAVNLATDAVTIGQDRFFSVSGEQTRVAALAISREIVGISERFRTLYNRKLMPISRRVNTILESDRIPAIGQLSNEIDTVGKEFDSLLSDIARIVSRIQVLQQDSREQIVYLDLLRRIVEKDYYGTLSLANTIEGVLEYEIGIILNRHQVAFQRRFERARTAMGNLQLASASLESSLARAIAESLVRNVRFVAPIGDVLTVPIIADLVGQNIEQAAVLLTYYSYRSTIELLYQITAASRSALLESSQPASSIANQSLDDQDAVYQRYLAEWRATEAEIISVNQRIDNAMVSSVADKTNKTVANFLTDSTARSAQLYNQYFADIVSQYRSRIDDSENMISDIRPLVYGIDSTSIRTDDIQLVKRYPQEAIPILSDSLLNIDEILDELLEFEPLYRSLQSTLTDSLDNTFDNLLARAVNVGNMLRALQTDAEQSIAEAIRLRDSGDRVRSQAEAALNLNNGRRANTLWNQARADYLDSLALREDEQLRLEIEQVSGVIRDQILELEHAEVVREVRNLINRSRRAVVIQDIDEAYSLIEQAADLWAITNVELNPEIVRQQEYIELVLTFEQAYNLAITDPLYGVLSGYLSSATQNIELINQFINQGSSSDAEALITETRRAIQNVISVQPFNTEARTLNLRLIGVIDANELQQILGDLFESASRGARREPRQSLSDFYTIRTLRPNYPGVEQEIADLETALGLRIIASNTNNQQEASRLLSRAQTLIETGDRNRAIAAETLLQEALVLDPSSGTVQTTLDQLRISNGSTAQANLSVDDEQLLRRAETLFVQGNIAQTFAILENLWRTPPNRNYPPLISLRNQVISRLGI